MTREEVAADLARVEVVKDLYGKETHVVTLKGGEFAGAGMIVGSAAFCEAVRSVLAETKVDQWFAPLEPVVEVAGG